MGDNVLLERTYRFALDTIALSRRLDGQREYVLANQLLRAGTSVGAHVEEARGAQSRADWIAKLFIALKEARESHYWLRLLRDSNLLLEHEHLLIPHSDEIIALLTRILTTARNRTANP